LTRFPLAGGGFSEAPLRGGRNSNSSLRRVAFPSTGERYVDVGSVKC
jgi:hypothetical protein